MKYKKIIKMCELEEDLEILPAGDQTQIGERGINLSGGQKQRISIARAVYSDSDIYLIDDALSALDAQVGKSIMKNVFKGHLKSKTRVIVTHLLNFLTEVDQVFLMSEGRISLSGTYEKIQNTSQFREFCAHLDEYSSAE